MRRTNVVARIALGLARIAVVVVIIAGCVESTWADAWDRSLPDAGSAATRKNLVALSTQTVVPDVSGTMPVAHDGRYGDLAGKVVSLEPATGFSFDTLLEPRPK